MNVYQKLQTARIQLQKMELKKSGYNNFAKYPYFELGDFLPQTNALFHEIGLCGVVTFLPDMATLSIINTDKLDEVIQFNSPMAAADLKGCHPIQNLGAIETYQRRYLWVAAMEIVEHDALDASQKIDTTKFIKPISKINPTETVRCVKSVSKETFDELSFDVQEDLRNIAMEVIFLLNKDDVEGAFAYIQMQELDADLRVGLNALFDSKQRAMLKKFKQERLIEKETA